MSKMDWVAVGIGVMTYASCKRKEAERGDKFGLGTSGGAFLSIYALSKIKPMYGAVGAALWLGSEVISDLRNRDSTAQHLTGQLPLPPVPEALSFARNTADTARRIWDLPNLPNIGEGISGTVTDAMGCATPRWLCNAYGHYFNESTQCCNLCPPGHREEVYRDASGRITGRGCAATR
jgi:hypothetical protein